MWSAHWRLCPRGRATSWCCRPCTATATRKSPTCSVSRSAPARRNYIAVDVYCASAWAWMRRLTMSDKSQPKRSLDELLASVPRDVEPERDLWEGIQAEIAKTPIVTDAAPVVHFGSSRWFQIAAGLLLVLATSVTTFVITRQSMEKDAAVQVANTPLPTP